MTPAVQRITSRDNPLVKDIRKLVVDNTAYRKLGKVWMEGEHLLLAARHRQEKVLCVVFSDSFNGNYHEYSQQSDTKIIVISDQIFSEISGLEDSARIGLLLDLPPPLPLDPFANSLILDRVQDAGNVGSMLRSAAAFGFTQVVALKGTAALWSPKVTRAGMGAHFGLNLIEGVAPERLRQLQTPILVTSSHRGDWLGSMPLPSPCAWALGHEGQGVGSEVAALAQTWVRIRQPGGEESLNVASAAAICLHESVRQCAQHREL
jgi:RNA methyltransferase, TrmH family